MSDIIVKFKPMGQKKLIDAINRLEEAQGKAKELRKKGYDFVCNEDDLETWVTQTWNEVWEGYNHG